MVPPVIWAASLRSDRKSTWYFYLPVMLLDNIDCFIRFFDDLFAQFCTRTYSLLFLPLLSEFGPLYLDAAVCPCC
jgi:hypothetical protein